MNTSIIKILTTFFLGCDLTNVVFKPLGIRLTSLNLVDYLSDNDIKTLFYNRGLVRKLDNLQIMGVASPAHVKEFLNIPESKVLIKTIIEKTNAELSAEEYIDMYKRKED
nr:MAG TPA: hypothetical protein [Caudoviricetes sp.]